MSAQAYFQAQRPKNGSCFLISGTPSPLTAWEVSAHQQKQARTDPPSPRQPAVASAAVADNRVRVRWDDGTESRFGSDFLMLRFVAINTTSWK